MKSGYRKQQGVATLLTVIVLMLLATMTILTASRAATSGQTMFSYERDYEQGFRNAEEGLRAADSHAAGWSINASTGQFVCNSSQTTYSVTGKYNAVTTCSPTVLTLVSNGMANSSNLNAATAVAKTTYTIQTNSTTTQTTGTGSHKPLVVTGNGTVTSAHPVFNITDVSNNSDHWGLGGALSAPGNSGHDSSITNYDTLTAEQVNNFKQLASLATVTVTEPSSGNLCDFLNTTLQNNPTASIIKVNLASGDSTFTVANCNNTNGSGGAAGTPGIDNTINYATTGKVPTLIFNGDLALSGNTVTFTDVNVLVLGAISNVQTLNVKGDSDGVPTYTTTTTTTQTSALQQGSWIDY